MVDIAAPNGYLNYIIGSYLTVLDRAVEPSFLTSQLTSTNPIPLPTLIDSLLSSNEAQNRYPYLKSLSPSPLDTTNFIVSIYQNAFGRTPEDVEIAAVTAYLDSPGATAGQFVYSVLVNAQGTDRDALQNRANVSYNFSNETNVANIPFNTSTAGSSATIINPVTFEPETVIAADAAIGAFVTGTPTGNTFTLTTGADTASGTFIDGSRFLSGGVFVNTLNSSDKISGTSATSDTLFAQFADGVTVTPLVVANIEVIQIENLSKDPATLNLANADKSVATVKVSNSLKSTTVTNIQSAPTKVQIENNDKDVIIGVVPTALTGTSDSVALTMSSVTGGTVTLQPTAVGSGYETVTVESLGTVNNSITLTDGDGNSLTTVNIKGSKALTLVLNDSTVTTVNAAVDSTSVFSAPLFLTVAAGSGNQTITGGSSSDIIDMKGTYTTGDTINGGDGTNTLVLKNTEATGATTPQANVSNIQNIQVSNPLNGTVSVNNFGATGLILGDDLGGNSTVNYAAGTNSLNLGTFKSAGFDLTGNIAGTGTTDILNVTIGSPTAPNNFGNGNVTISGAETVNLLSQGGGNKFGGKFIMTPTAAPEKLVITGNQNITFSKAVTADNIDASGMTGSASLTLNGGTTNATDIKGTANADILVGSTAGDLIDGGAGNDTIANEATGTATTAADVLTGGGGFDTFTLRGSAASISGDTGGTQYAKASQIADFLLGSTTTTTDILELSATAANYTGTAGFAAGIVPDGAGSTAIQNIAQNAAPVAYLAGVDLIKLTTGIATTGLTVQQSFNTAIGSGTVTGVGAGLSAFASFYDTTNSRMVIGVVNSFNGANGTIQSGDVFTLIGSTGMSAADYGNFNQNNLAIVAA